MAGKFAAQEARRAGQLRADDVAYLTHAGARFQAGAEVINTGTDAAASGRATADAVPGPLYELVSLCRERGLPEPIPEYRFHATRRWRFDFAWPLFLVAVEVEGGIWTQGRHTRGPGVLADMEKYNAAAIIGWRILRYSPQTLGNALDDLRFMLRRKDTHATIP